VLFFLPVKFSVVIVAEAKVIYDERVPLSLLEFFVLFFGNLLNEVLGFLDFVLGKSVLLSLLDLLEFLEVFLSVASHFPAFYKMAAL